MNIDQVADIGKDVFMRTWETGAFFFPKIVVERVDGAIEIAQYETGYDSYLHTLAAIMTFGPIKSLSHTADSYHVRLIDVPEDQREVLYQRLQDGDTSATQLFEEGFPHAYESLNVILVTLTDLENGDVTRDHVHLPYKRHPDRIEWLPAEEPDGVVPRGRYVVGLEEALKASYAVVQK